jgi:glycerophosphoryl diester phosphodiesterase
MRTTGFDKTIDEETFMELQSLDCSYGFGEEWKNEKIPEIKEVFSILPHDKDIFIEVKTKEVIVPYLLQEIESQKAALNQITVISFYPEVIRRIKERNVNIKCNLLVAFDYENIKTSKIEEIILSIGADGLGAQNHKRFNNELIKMLRNINKSVHVWTVNSTDDAEYYIKKDVDSITTNRPYFLRNHLKKMK